MVRNYFDFLGAAYLVTEHPLSDLAGVAVTIGQSFVDSAKTVQRLPGFWLAVAFLVGMAVSQWLIPFIRERRAQPVNDILTVGEWYPPHEAVQRFANPTLLERQTQAHSLLGELSDSDPKRALAEYLVERIKADILDDVQDQLTNRLLIAKGFPVKRGKTLPFEKQIDFYFWKLKVVGMPLSSISVQVKGRICSVTIVG